MTDDFSLAKPSSHLKINIHCIVISVIFYFSVGTSLSGKMTHKFEHKFEDK